MLRIWPLFFLVLLTLLLVGRVAWRLDGRHGDCISYEDEDSQVQCVFFFRRLFRISMVSRKKNRVELGQSSEWRRWAQIPGRAIYQRL